MIRLSDMKPEDLVPTAEQLQEADREVAVIMLSRGFTQLGIRYWAYLAVPPSKCQAFRTMKPGVSFNVVDYGPVLRMGYGSEPPAEVIKEMEEMYGARMDFEEEIMRRAVEMQATLESEQKNLDQELRDIEKRKQKADVKAKYTGKKNLPDSAAS